MPLRRVQSFADSSLMATKRGSARQAAEKFLKPLNRLLRRCDVDFPQ
jgi:hypothetical protein